MSGMVITFRLPEASWPRAIFESDYGMRTGRLTLEGEELLAFEDRAKLEQGIETDWRGRTLALHVENERDVSVTLDGAPALREDRLHAPPSRSAWIHAFVALFASFAGFVASYLYLLRAEHFDDPWALKMSIHMAGWHLLLTLTLFPASVWGQRVGIRAVQGISLLFFLIHAGIAAANTSQALDGPWIAALNALSGLFFLIAVLYGQVAHRDMNPLRALGTRADQCA